jgi:hypothetical protein
VAAVDRLSRASTLEVGQVRGRTGVRKAVVGAAVLAAVGLLLLLFHGGVPLIPGRAPTTPDPDPVGLPPGGPITDIDASGTLLSQLALEMDDLRAPEGPQGLTPASDLRAPVVFSVADPGAYVDAEVDRGDGRAELDRDGGEVRPPVERSSRVMEVLASILLTLSVVKASRDQHRNRRLRAEAPASAA